MICRVCHNAFEDEDLVIPVQRYIVDETRGDWITTQADVGAVHLSHVTEGHSAYSLNRPIG